MDKLSIVVPCYNEEDSVLVFYNCVSEIIRESRLAELEIEYIFVDDGSVDTTLEKMQELAKKDGAVKYVSFSRNFGKEAALLAGLANSTGDYIVTMDVDLQDSPYVLEEMYLSVKNEDFDCVAARREDRKGEGKIRSILSQGFYQCHLDKHFVC